MLATTQNYKDRIHRGKEVELQIINKLKSLGYHIDPPTEHEDMFHKIDGWWVTKNHKYSFQIKFRERGDDIIFELIQNMDTQNPGRDLKSKATLYIVMDTKKNIRMFLTKPIKDKANEILSHIKIALQKTPLETNFSGNGWEAKIQYDRAHGQKKLVAYFDPKLFEALATWNLNS